MYQKIQDALNGVALNLEHLLGGVEFDHALPERFPDQNLLDHGIVLRRNVEPLANIFLSRVLKGRPLLRLLYHVLPFGPLLALWGLLSLALVSGGVVPVVPVVFPAVPAVPVVRVLPVFRVFPVVRVVPGVRVGGVVLGLPALEVLVGLDQAAKALVLELFEFLKPGPDLLLPDDALDQEFVLLVRAEARKDLHHIVDLLLLFAASAVQPQLLLEVQQPAAYHELLPP